MIILIACIERRGEAIARLLSERLELPLVQCEGFTVREIEEVIQTTSSSILLTNQVLNIKKSSQMLHIYLYGDSEDPEAGDERLNAAPIIRFDMGMDISNLSNRACAETICQFTAIRRMHSLKSGRS